MVAGPMGLHDHPRSTFRLLAAGWLSLVAAFALLPAKAASITGFTPGHGSTGTEVTVVGTGLQTATTVYFGSTDAPGEILGRSATTLLVRVPANAFTGQISVFTSSSGAASSSQFFVAAPRVDGFTPLTGSPGTVVTINGFNFGTALTGGKASVTNVLFNGVPARFQIIGINQLLAVVPTEATSGPITVANVAGSLTTLVPFQLPALVSSLTPFAAVPGGTVEVRGQNLGSTLKVELGLVPVPFSVVSATNLLLTIPTNAINNRLQITTGAGTTTTSSNLVVLPRIIRFTPTNGPSGTAVTLEGGGLHGVTDVRFSDLHANFTPVSSLRIDAVVPPGAVSGPIQVITTNGTFTTASDFALPARITSLNPGTGKRGDVITVDGQNLRGTSRVRLNGVETAFTLVSASRFTFTIPAAATSGRLVVTTPAGDIESPSTITVRAVLDGFSPANGAVGSVFHVLGAGFTNITWIRLGGIDATFTPVSTTDLRAVVPLNAFSGPIRIRASDGTELETTANFFVDGAKPTIASFAPTSGTAGTKVLLQGNGLRSTSKVQFDSLEAAFTVKSPTQIEATVPNNAVTGIISVNTLDGIAQTATAFVVDRQEVTLRCEVGVGTFVLRWPATALGYTLESSPRVGPDAIWQAVGQPPVVDGADWRVAVVLPQTNSRYFRLRR